MSMLAERDPSKSAAAAGAARQHRPARVADGSGRPFGRLRCDARGRVAPQNSLRARRALRSDSCGESVGEARFARRPCLCASRRSPRQPEPTCAVASARGAPKLAHPPTAPAPRRRRSEWVGIDLSTSAGGGALWRACGSPRSARCEAGARSAPRPQTCGSCLSAAPAGRVASSAAGPRSRAPQGSRPFGPTDTPKRLSAPPFAERGLANQRRPAMNPGSTTHASPP